MARAGSAQSGRMCLAVPGRILRFVSDEAALAEVEFGGVVKRVCTAYVPEAQLGDYVIVHVGFAIARLDEAQARRSLDAIAELTRYQAGRSPEGAVVERGSDADGSVPSGEAGTEGEHHPGVEAGA